MNTVFDSEQLPKRRLCISKTVSLVDIMNTKESILAIKREMAMQLATKMLAEPIFIENTWSVGGVWFVDYRVDCIVLTIDEFASMRNDAFKEGLLHAQRFMPNTLFRGE